MSNIIAFPTRFGASDCDRIILSRGLRTGQDGAPAILHVVHHVDHLGKPIAQLWVGREYRDAMAAAEAASAERRALIEIDIRAVRS